MRKSLMMAAALVALGTGSAFAGDGDVRAEPPAPSSFEMQSPVPAQRAEQHRMFPAGMSRTTNIYTLFGAGGFAQGGEA